MFEDGGDLDLGAPAPPPAEESSNRTFLIVAGILAGIVLISLVCLAVYAFLYLPSQQGQRTAQQATIEAHNAQLQQEMTQTAEAALWTNTPQPSPEATATNTPSPTPTGTLIVETPIDPMTATAAALQTQVALALLTPTSTLIAMPRSGIAEEFGLPGLIIMAIALVVIILLVRRLRTAPSR